MVPLTRLAGSYSDQKRSRNLDRLRLFPVVLFTGFLLPVFFPTLNAHSASLLVREAVHLKPVKRTEIAGALGKQQTRSLGTAAGRLRGKPPFVVKMPITNAPLALNRYIERRVDGIWELDFDNREWFGKISVEVNYRVEDDGGKVDQLSSRDNPDSRVAVAVQSAGERIRRHRNGSLNWIRGDADFQLDILSAKSAGRYSGTLTVEVIFF